MKALFSVESRFCTQALGMTKHDYLSRGSAFLMVHKGQLGLMTCSHITQPFRFPHYYRDSMKWLGLVQPEDLEFQMTLVSPTTGQALYELPLPGSLLRLHPQLDCCGFIFPKHLELDKLLFQLQQVLSSADQLQFDPRPYRTVPAAPAFATGATRCLGFDYSGNRMEQQVDTHTMLAVEGHTLSPHVETALRRDPHSQDLLECQEFRVETASKLNFGMCGGPVVLAKETDGLLLLGMVEGIAQDGTVHCVPTQTLESLF